MSQHIVPHKRCTEFHNGVDRRDRGVQSYSVSMRMSRWCNRVVFWCLGIVSHTTREVAEESSVLKTEHNIPMIKPC